MDKPRSAKRPMRTYTVGALLALFVMAAVLALASRLLPGGMRRAAGTLLHRNEPPAPNRQ
jgi:hypothetical protein